MLYMLFITQSNKCEYGYSDDDIHKQSKEKLR